MKASTLILVLQQLIQTHGDKEVYSGGEDYPGKVRGVTVQKEDNGYVPKGAFDIIGGI